ncbi:RNA-directed DNA polymerase, eukaryota, reverse transcriptase zinc-binding domain protein [Tanacetum coccineum]|uniref:RNA-directed DNA polymerase, eukaryota, reverse transcriptase zinc-binding domain protein n=1 Tax=Tanacetum coccineum TaxID=301880 RepID=A0ABQ4WW44_9ASTR
MAGVSMNKSDPNGWTWVFGKNKKHHTKPIDNLFVKDVERIAASFFVMNFPDSFDAKGLWKECEPYGRIVGAFIAILVARMFPVNQSYASLTHSDAISKVVRLNGENANCIQLRKNDLIKVEDTTNVILVKVKEVDSIDDLVSNDSGDRHDVEECRSLNDEEDPNNGVNVLSLGFDKVLEVNSVGDSFSMESVKDEHVVKQNEVENQHIDSDATIPPSFENLFKAFLRLFIQNHTGKIILFGDLNEVMNETERFGCSFSSGDATIFNSFIHDIGLIGLLMGGRMFTWMNKDSSKLRKIDRFLIFDGVLQAHSDVQVTVFDRVWTDHNLILLHLLGQICQLMKGSTKSLHDKLKGLKVQLELWYSRCVNDEDRALCVRLQELDGLEKLEFMDFVQKARVQWEVEGNENSKFLHDIINSRRKSHEQSAFIPGHQNFEGPLILNEVIDWYKNQKKKMMLFKVDFEKVFDSVSWIFLDHVLEKLGFGVKWCGWIKVGLVSAQTSILLNGGHTLEFSLRRGLRRRDPLSPFLFIIVMEVGACDYESDSAEMRSRHHRLNMHLSVSNNRYGRIWLCHSSKFGCDNFWFSALQYKYCNYDHVDSKNLLDRVSSCTSLFSLSERLKADYTIRVNQLVTI